MEPIIEAFILELVQLRDAVKGLIVRPRDAARTAQLSASIQATRTIVGNTSHGAGAGLPARSVDATAHAVQMRLPWLAPAGGGLDAVHSRLIDAHYAVDGLAWTDECTALAVYGVGRRTLVRWSAENKKRKYVRARQFFKLDDDPTSTEAKLTDVVERICRNALTVSAINKNAERIVAARKVLGQVDALITFYANASLGGPLSFQLSHALSSIALRRTVQG